MAASFLTWLIVVFAPPTTSATVPHPKGYVSPKASVPIRVDGRLDDPAWARAPWTDDFVDIEGDARPKPRFRTRVKMLWDDRYFYVAAEMEEPDVWGTLTDHDSVIFRDNDFEVFVDPDGDNHEYYEYEINALNTGWDLFLPKPYRDGGPAENGWEIPGLKTAVAIQGSLNNPRDRDQGWTVELAFPWTAFADHAHQSLPPKNGDRWRVNFSRVEWLTDVVDGKTRKRPDTREDNWVWSPQGAIDMHRPERWGYVEFTEGKSAVFRSDPAWPARAALIDVYWAQRKRRDAKQPFTLQWSELGLTPPSDPALDGPPKIYQVPNGSGYEALIQLRRGETWETWSVNAESRMSIVLPP